MKTILLTLLPVLLLAQPPSRQSRFLDYEPDAENTVLKLRDTLAADGTIIFAEPALKLIALYADSTERLDRAEQLIRKYYKPKEVARQTDTNVELYFYLLQARETNEASETIAALNPVLAQLRQLTPYKSFRTVESLIVRSQGTRQFVLLGALPWVASAEEELTTYRVQGDALYQRSLIVLNDVHFSGKVPVKTMENRIGFSEFSFRTALSFKPGQFAVVGKTTVTPKDGALVLVVTGRLVD
jgi:hypothetical protein